MFMIRAREFAIRMVRVKMPALLGHKVRFYFNKGMTFGFEIFQSRLAS